MKADNQLVCFRVLTEKQLSEALSSEVEGVCTFKFESVPSEYVDAKSFLSGIKLEIRGNFLLERNMETSQIKSGIKFYPEFEFKIERKNIQENENLNENYLQNYTLVLSFVGKINWKTQQMKLISEEPSNFVNFCQTLKKKNITQIIEKLDNFYKLLKKTMFTRNLYQVKNLANGKHFNVRAISRNQFSYKQLHIIGKLHHENICKCHQIYRTENTFYLIFDYYSSSLLDWIHVEKCWEFLTPNFIRKILETLQCLKEAGIMHREIKPQTIMISKEREPILFFFDSAENTNSPQYENPFCGAPGYIGPEIFEKCAIKKENPSFQIQYSEACDMFSVGAILFVMLTGIPLFAQKQMQKLIKENERCLIDFDRNQFISLPEELRILLRAMLVKNPNNRITPIQALNSPIFYKQIEEEYYNLTYINEKEQKLV